VLAVVGKGDRYWCNQHTMGAFLAPVPGELVELRHVGRVDRGTA